MHQHVRQAQALALRNALRDLLVEHFAEHPGFLAIERTILRQSLPHGAQHHLQEIGFELLRCSPDRFLAVILLRLQTQAVQAFRVEG